MGVDVNMLYKKFIIYVVCICMYGILNVVDEIIKVGVDVNLSKI